MAYCSNKSVPEVNVIPVAGLGGSHYQGESLKSASLISKSGLLRTCVTSVTERRIRLTRRIVPLLGGGLFPSGLPFAIFRQSRPGHNVLHGLRQQIEPGVLALNKSAISDAT